MRPCPVCGSNLNLDINVDVMTCSCCGGIFDVTTSEQISSIAMEDIRPSFVIPFAIDEKEAGDILKKTIADTDHVKLSYSMARPEKQLKKVYIPAYVMTSVSTIALTGEGLYKRDKRIMTNRVEAMVQMRLLNVPFVCSDFNRAAMQAAEPFDWSKAQAVPEELMDIVPDTDSREMGNRFFKRTKDISNGVIKEDKLSYDVLRYVPSQVLYEPSEIELKSCLLPFYITDAGGAQIVINGQTGKVGGDIPNNAEAAARRRENSKTLFYYAAFIASWILIGIFTILRMTSTTGHQEGADIINTITANNITPDTTDWAGGLMISIAVTIASLFFMVIIIPAVGHLVRLLTLLVFPNKEVPKKTSNLHYLDDNYQVKVSRKEEHLSNEIDPEHTASAIFRKVFWPEIP